MCLFKRLKNMSANKIIKFWNKFLKDARFSLIYSIIKINESSLQPQAQSSNSLPLQESKFQFRIYLANSAII